MSDDKPDPESETNLNAHAVQGVPVRHTVTRGLASRLQRPVERDLPQGDRERPPPVDSAPPSSRPHPGTQGLLASTAQVQHAGQLETRRVAGKPQPTHEGLLGVGTQLQARYKILGVIGVGGMGAVYRAQDLRFPGVMRLCAVKEMINTATDRQVREMIIRNFEREASILATLSHPAIPQVYDYFTEDNRSYLVLEFVQGQDLEARVSEIDGFFSESQVVDWIIQLCDVLSFLHNHKPRPIIFRDLKPSNVMLDDQGRIRLVDFGIAKLFQSGEKGTMIGTEGYSPPEQYRGVAEPRGDLYAIGATMHHLLSKQDPRLEPPFSFKERPIHRTNPTVSQELLSLIDRLLEYDVNARLGSAEELRRALLALSAPRRPANGQLNATMMLTTGGVKPIWRFACEDEVRGSVCVSEALILAPSYDHNIYALDIEEGTFVWKYAAEGGIASSPALDERVAVFASTDRVVYVVDIRTGSLAWTAPTEGRVFSSPAIELGHVFIGSDDKKLYALQLQSGRTAWTYPAEGAVRSRPFVDDNLVIFSCSQGIVYAIDLRRDLKWQFRARRGILASPIVHANLVMIGSLDWYFYGLDRRSGWVVWKHRTNGPIASTAAVHEDTVIFGAADNSIYALQMSDGRVVWRYQTEGQVTGSVTVHQGVVYVGSVDGALYSIDARSGALRWRYETDGAITGAPRVADGVVYFGSSDHYVYALPA
jgi:eukaryotic-like serine/threonine-protein kinase